MPTRLLLHWKIIKGTKTTGIGEPRDVLLPIVTISMFETTKETTVVESVKTLTYITPNLTQV